MRRFSTIKLRNLNSDFAVTLLGGSPCSPPAWRQLFWPGSTVQPDRRIYPGKDELMAGFEAGHRRTVEAARRVNPEMLAQAQPGPFYLEDFQTVGDLVAHLPQFTAEWHTI